MYPIGHSIVVAETTNLSRADWLSLRRQGIGGSDVPAILGLSRFATPLSVWRSKTEGDASDGASEAAAWGHRLEDIIAERFEESTGLAVFEPGVLVRHPDHAHMLANIDRCVAGLGRVKALLEVKLRRFMDDSWNPAENQVPDDVRLQCDWYMAVTGLDLCYVAALFAGQEMHVFELTRDLDHEPDLVDWMADWWKSRVVGGIPPHASGADSKALGLWYPGTDGDVDASPEALEAVRTKLANRGPTKALDESSTDADVVIKQALGNATQLVTTHQGQRVVVAKWSAVQPTKNRVWEDWAKENEGLLAEIEAAGAPIPTGPPKIGPRRLTITKAGEQTLGPEAQQKESI